MFIYYNIFRYFDNYLEINLIFTKKRNIFKYFWISIINMFNVYVFSCKNVCLKIYIFWFFFYLNYFLIISIYNMVNIFGINRFIFK